jgi:predicted CXXCH cytochrome family protein
MCHTTHKLGNPKLLVEARESNLCDNCHAGIDKFNAFSRRTTVIKLYVDRPSRFNVFSSVGNSFGNYSVGGGDVVSWHEVDGTHPAPGGRNVELRCGKCHNPHGEDNFAMLRNTVENVSSIRVFGRLSSTGPFNTYSSGFAKFCSACHTKLNKCGTGNPWTRHPVDFKLERAQYYNWSTTDITPRVPIETGRQVTCITCHNSHGSTNYYLQREEGNRMCQQCHNR